MMTRTAIHLPVLDIHGCISNMWFVHAHPQTDGDRWRAGKELSRYLSSRPDACCYRETRVRQHAFFCEVIFYAATDAQFCAWQCAGLYPRRDVVCYIAPTIGLCHGSVYPLTSATTLHNYTLCRFDDVEDLLWTAYQFQKYGLPGYVQRQWL